MYRDNAKRSKFRLASAMRKKPTVAERLLRAHLNRATKNSPLRFQFQCIVFGWILDFYCAKKRVAVEVDGASHEGRRLYDANRDAVLRHKLGIITLRFSNEEVAVDPRGVVEKILAFCETRETFAAWNAGRKK